MLKSFLHEASDVCRAINEAWEQSDKPVVFTVKIIDAGKKGFLGFSHRPAKISFTYECSQVCSMPANQLRQIVESSSASNKESRQPTLTQSNNSSVGELRKLPNNRDARTTSNKPAEKIAVEKKPAPQPRPQKMQPISRPAQTLEEKTAVVENKNEVVIESPEMWPVELSSEALVWLEGFFQVLGQTVQATVTESKNELLVVTIASPTFKDSLAEALFKDNLFACACATLAVQSLRNKKGQRFKGLKIKIIT